MKQVLVLFIIVVSAATGFFVGTKIGFNTGNVEDNKKTYSIAIMLPVSHAALEEIQQGFIETLNQSVTAQYEVYNAQGDRTLMRNQAEQIAGKSYDLIFAIATQPAIMIKEVTAQRKNMIPIVAGAVDDPVENNLIASMQSSGNNVTAVTSNMEEQFLKNYVSIATFLKPAMKKVLLPYTSTPGLEKDKDQLVSLLHKAGIHVTLLPVSSLQDMLQKIPFMISGHDAIFVLRDNNVVAGIEALSLLSSRHGTTLFALDLNSVEKGAAVGYGVKEYDFGVESAKRAIQILQKKQHSSDVASGVVSNFRLKLNKDVMEKQSLLLDSGLLLALSSSEVIYGDVHD